MPYNKMNGIGIASTCIVQLLAVGASPVLAHRQRTAGQKFVYEAGGEGCPYVLQYRFGTDSQRRPLSPPSASIIGSAYLVVVSPDKRSVYVPEGDYFGVAQFHVLYNGTLAQMRPADVAADAHPTSMVFDPSGRHAYVSCSHGCVCQYRVRRNGALTPLSPLEVSVASGGTRDPSIVKFSLNGHIATVTADRTVGERDKLVLFRYRVMRSGQLVFTGSCILSDTADK